MPVHSYEKQSQQQGGSVLARDQHRRSSKGRRHTNFDVTYAKKVHPIDLFRQQFHIFARTPNGDIHLGPLAEQVTWTDDSAATGGASTNLLQYQNTTITLTGSVQLRKPSLNQYRNLVLPAFDASINRTKHGATSRFGALGTPIVLALIQGRTQLPIWAMRVAPTQQGQGAEEVDLQDGSWTLQLTDDSTLIGESVDDFKFTKGKKLHRRGWRAHDITIEVCREYGIPLKTLPRGTAYFELPPASTRGVSPLDVIRSAWDEEQNRTGKAFVIRWSAPTRRHPLGALEIVPMRRNPHLIHFRDQLINAVLTRSQSADFATAVQGRATLKHPSGKHKELTYDYHDPRAVKRFGWVFKRVPFKPVESMRELQILTKRWLGFHLTPLRSAELTNPGIATIRRGDAIRIDIPEEGYGKAKLSTYETPDASKAKYTSRALKQAELLDPTLFGLSDINALSPTSTSTSNEAVPIPVADQSIAFVIAATHTLSATDYTMDLITGFNDILDPTALKTEIEANIRNGKAVKTATGVSSVSGGGQKWRVPASAEDDPPGAAASCGPLPADRRGYSVLSVSGRSSDAATAGQALSAGSVWPCSTQLIITNPANGQQVTVNHVDNGAGSDSILPVVGLYPQTRADLGLDNSGSYTVIIQRADGGSMNPVRGTKV